MTLYPAARELVHKRERRLISQIEAVLPANRPGEARRLISRALLYLQTAAHRDDLARCAPESFLLAIVKAAEAGLPIDGQLGYLIPRGNVLCFEPSYIGLIAAARRSQDVADVFARCVYESDEFSFGHENGKDFLRHVQARRERGTLDGVYAVLRLLEGQIWRYDYMTRDEVEHVRATSSSAPKSKAWIEHFPEMAKKTVLRRLLKTYRDDPHIAGALDSDQESVYTRAPEEVDLAPFVEPTAISERKSEEKESDEPFG